MTNELDSQDSLYQYFVVEALELLQTIEETLFSLLEEKTPDKVHTLMRSAHTLKGGAASVEQETIGTIAHHLEDVFEALHPPELEVDPELGSLLLQGYECLKTPLDATISGSSYDEAAILEQTATVFAQLQTKLGDFFGREAPILNSDELGFDVVGSIFADSIPDDLQQLEAAIATEDPEKIQTVLSTQAEFFMDLGSSYNLPGLEAIASSALSALANHPDLVLSIATVTLNNLQQSCELVLAGDREFGGEVSPELLNWAESTSIENQSAIEVEAIPAGEEISSMTISQSSSSELTQIIDEDREEITQVDLTDEKENTLTANSERENYLVPTSPIDRILQSIGVGKTETVESVSQEIPSPVNPSKTNSTLDPALPSIRVAIKQLDLLNHTIGELLIDENQQNLQSEQMYSLAQQARKDFLRCQKQLDRIYDWSNKHSLSSKKRRQKYSRHPQKIDRDLFFQSHNLSPSILKETETAFPNEPNYQLGFDELEMDVYSDLHLLLQTLNSTMSQLEEKIESIEREFQGSHLHLGKRKQLLNRAQKELFQTRMIPLGTVLNRFPRTLQLMVATHQKPAELKLRGTEVLVDKAIAEKIYDPLLHLLRNAYDHGIETPEVRHSQGKLEAGQITIKAYNQGNRTTIEVRDNGQGLNWESIRAKAIAKNLLTSTAAANASEAELAEILFEPGFSTAEKLSDLSGRGVGLDVVRSQLQTLQGSVSVSSEPGRGTTFILQLPLNVTTARLLVCQCQGVTYALLSRAISQILLPQSEQIQQRQSIIADGSQSFFLWNKGVDKQLVPIRSLDELVNYQYPIFAPDKTSVLSPFPIKQRNNITPLLILQTGDRYLGLQVEQILVEQELVIKSLGSMPDLPDYIQGYSVLGDSSLALVIEPMELAAQTWSTNFPASSRYPRLPNKSLAALTRTTETKEPGSEPPSLSPSPNPSNKNSTVLVVDDSLVQRQSLVLTLKKAGYKVLQAEHGQEAIAQLNKHQQINLVICDVEMPVMNGFEFLQSYHQDPRLSSIPVVMLTTRSGQKHRQAAFSLGAKAYLTKPYSEPILLDTIVSQLINKSSL